MDFDLGCLQNPLFLVLASVWPNSIADFHGHWCENDLHSYGPCHYSETWITRTTARGPPKNVFELSEVELTEFHYISCMLVVRKLPQQINCILFWHGMVRLWLNFLGLWRSVRWHAVYDNMQLDFVHPSCEYTHTKLNLWPVADGF